MFHNGMSIRIAVGLLLGLCLTSMAWAETDSPTDVMAAVSEGSYAPGHKMETTEPEPPEWTKTLPVSFGVDYWLASDYVFRGINFSEYAGEGREDLNHQLNLAASVDTPVGTFGGYVWFEWFAGQEVFTPGEDTNLQEVDYCLHWSYTIEPLGLTPEVGWIAYTFPPASGDFHTTYEAYAKLSYDDSKLFGTENGVLNPYIYYGLDYDLGDNGSWIEMGVSHDFALADCPRLAKTFLKDFTITPSLVLGADHRYLDKFALAGSGQEATRLAFLNYGLDLDYDVSSALNMPEKYGALSVGTFVRYSQALRDDLLNDEFYGGMKVGYSW